MGVPQIIPGGKPRRLRMIGSTQIAAQSDAGLIGLTPDDAEKVGHLLYHAYPGTVDYEGESLEEFIAEAAASFGGRYGAARLKASFAVPNGQEIVGITLVTDFLEDIPVMPLLAYCVVHPDFQGKGVATRLLTQTLNELANDGIKQVRLAVHPGNFPALALYRKLGFREELARA